MLCFIKQLEQEFDLILSKEGLFRTFSTDWTRKWMPSIIKYCKRLKRKDIKEIMKKMGKGRFCNYSEYMH